MGDLGKFIVAKGVKKLPKVQKIAQSGHTDSKVRYCPVNHYTVFQQDCLVALMGASGKGASANHAVFLQKKLGHSRPHFLIVVFSIQLTVNVQKKFCWWLIWNRGPLELEATILPTEPQSLPKTMLLAKVKVDQMKATRLWGGPGVGVDKKVTCPTGRNYI